MQSIILAECDGFNWHHAIDINDCDPSDVLVLKQFLTNSKNTLNMDMDYDYDGIISVTELGWQLWEQGRLIHWICSEVPSPYYYYEFDCNLSGAIPVEISKLDAIVKLHLDNNLLSGDIPESICELPNINFGEYWFNLDYNKLCPPYPNCLDKSTEKQNIENCN